MVLSNFCCGSRFLPLLLLLLFSGFLHLGTMKLGSCNGDFDIKCVETERKALLQLKAGLIDPSGRLSSWIGENCCSWEGVKCSNKTGRVLKLNLRNPSTSTHDLVSSLGGEINRSLLDLKRLNSLDLSFNNFRGTPVPDFIGSLKNLRYLNLSYAGFGGTIPPQLGNLSTLRYLDLNSISHDFVTGSTAKVNNLNWLSGLSSLKYLDMGSVDLGNAALHWLQAINRLSSLLELKLESCGLVNLHPSFSFVNFTSLAVLDLTENDFNSSIPHWLLNITSLSVLGLSNNHLQGGIPYELPKLTSLQSIYLHSNSELGGGIPRTLGSLCKLQILDLSSTGISGEITEFVDGLSRCTENNLKMLLMYDNELNGTIPSSLGQLKLLKSVILRRNSFWGSIPASIGNLSSLELLDLSFNQMNGTIPERIGQLSQLTSLDIYHNYWNGVITEAHFLNLTSLKEIQIGSLDGPMTLSFQVKDDWVPHFSLQTIIVRRVHLGTNLPTWLQTQSELYEVSLREVGISGTIPDWLWKFPQISFLDLSDNQISGKLPASLELSAQKVSIFLSGNKLEGPIPAWSTLSDLVLDLGNNLLSGSIPQNIWELMPRLRILDLSRNNLNGTIPRSISNLKGLDHLLLPNNQLSGELPMYWTGMQALTTIDLSNNSLFGHIPSSMGFLASLEWLILSNNNFDGEFPSTLKKCSNLLTLDVAGNRISGKLPTWIGGSLSTLAIIRLRSNLLTGNIPHQLCLLQYLHILDIADNNLSGVIPHCLGNLTGMVSPPQFVGYISEEMPLVIKGSQRTYSRDSLYYGKFLDISKNNLRGEIPVEITSLFGLISMNLSMNHLSGRIPEKIGGMKNLESLDLSRNQLSGPIPQTMSSLNFLSYLNLSYNNFSGRIPSGNQLQTLNDSSVYVGNPSLCGHPLETKCAGDETHQDPSSPGVSGGENENDDNGFEMVWFYTSMGVGFVVGFWGVCGTFFIKKSWRHAYFQFVEDLVERLLLTVALNVARLKRKIASARNERGH